MKLSGKVTASVCNSRVARSGESKGETKHSVQIFVIADDGIPATFAVYGLASAADAEALAAKYPAGTVIAVRNIPREPYFVDAAEISVEKGK